MTDNKLTWHAEAAQQGHLLATYWKQDVVVKLCAGHDGETKTDKMKLCIKYLAQ